MIIDWTVTSGAWSGVHIIKREREREGERERGREGERESEREREGLNF